MKDLYKGFKKISDDEKSAKLKHDNGHELLIAKSGLNKATLKMLEKLPLHQAEGTDPGGDDILKGLEAEMAAAKEGKSVEEPSFSGTAYRPESELNQPMPAPEYNSPEYEQLAKTWGGAENIPQNVVDDLTARGAPGFGSSSLAGAKETAAIEALDKQMGGAEQSGLAAPVQVKAQPQVQPQATIRAPSSPPVAPPLEKVVRTPEQIYADPNAPTEERYAAKMQIADGITKQMGEEDQKFREAVANDKIDPNRLYGNMNFGQRVSTILGLLLGGFGAAMGDGTNVVQKMLDKQIEMDVEEQKRQQGKKFNLHKLHMDTLGDKRAAEVQTANNLRQVALMKMERLSGMYGNNPMAQQKLLAESARLTSEIEKGKAEVAQAHFLNKMQSDYRAGRISELPDEIDPAKDRIVRIPDAMGKMVKYHTRNASEAAKVQEQSNSLSELQRLLGAVGDFNKEEGRAFFGEAADVASSLNAQMQAAITSVISKGNINPKLVAAFKDIAPRAGAFKQSDAEAKRRAAIAMVERMSKSLVEGYTVK